MDPIKAHDLMSAIFKNINIEIKVLRENIDMNKAKIKALRKAIDERQSR